MPKFCTLTVYFERECITCTGNKYMHNNLWQFLFNLIGKINRDGYSSLHSLIEIYILLNEILSRLSLEGKCQY